MQTLRSSVPLGSLVTAILGFVFLGMACCACVFPMTMLSGAVEERDWSAVALTLALPLIIGGFTGIAGALMLLWGMRPLIARLRLARPEVAVSATQLRPGESFQLTYRQALKGTVNVERFQVSLILREWVSYRRGTTTYTDTYDHTISSQEFPGRRYEAGETIDMRCTLRIPEDAMHSFDAYHNKLRWFLQIHVQVSGWPDFKDEYPLVVVAERAG